MVVIKHVIYGTVGSICGIQKTKCDQTESAADTAINTCKHATKRHRMLGRVRGA